MAKREEWRTAQFLKEDGTMLVFPKYEVSNIGRIRSLNYGHSGKTKLMKPGENSNGYYQITIWKDKKKCKHTVHRLIASTFLEIPDDPKLYECVNHKDENPHNNKVENLEWCTKMYNSKYGSVLERLSKTHINRKDISKPTMQIDPKSLDVITEFPSAAEAARQMGCTSSSIYRSIQRNHKCCGFYWKYK